MKEWTKPPPLQFGSYYHIYNRGINGENIFKEEKNYRYFLQLYVKYIESIAETYAYCLLKNRFHVLVRIKTEAEQMEAPNQTPEVFETPRVFEAKSPSQQFSNLLNAYSKAINKAYQRTGSLFSLSTTLRTHRSYRRSLFHPTDHLHSSKSAET